MTTLILADVRNGRIVRHRGRWGVACSGRGRMPHGKRVIDFWWEGREFLPAWAVVEVLA